MDGGETDFIVTLWGCTADRGLGASSVEAGRSPGLGRQVQGSCVLHTLAVLQLQCCWQHCWSQQHPGSILQSGEGPKEFVAWGGGESLV